MGPVRIAWIAESGRLGGAQVGGKAAGLARLTRSGLRVPAAFCVTTASYDEFVADNDLGDLLRLGGAAGLSEGEVEAWCLRARRAIAGGEMSPALQGDVATAYQRLAEGERDAPVVAIRSSATVEDLPGGSFAGVFASYLDVRGPEGILDHVRRCWATLWTPAAIVWIDRRGLHQHRYAMGVVVQRQIDARTAGVLFTANPTTGNPFEMVIHATRGLGEAIVSGTVEPDVFTVNAVDMTILGRRVAGEDPCASLSDAEALEVARQGARIVKALGRPQDVEWAIDTEGVHLLQTRPIVALPPYFPKQGAPPAPGIVELSLEFPDLFTPFGRSLEALKNPVYRRGVADALGARVDNIQATVHGYIYHQETVTSSSLLPRFAVKPLRAIRWAVAARDADRVFHEKAVPRLNARLERVRAELASAGAIAEELTLLDEAIAAYLDFERAAVLVGVIANASSALLLRWAKALFEGDSGFEPALLLAGLQNLTVERDRQLSDLRRLAGIPAIRVRLESASSLQDFRESARGEEEARFLEALDSFRARFGYVWAQGSAKDPCVRMSWDLAVSTLTSPDRESEPAASDRSAEACYRAAVARLQSGLGGRVLPLRRQAFDLLLAVARRYYPCREDYNHHLSSAVVVIGDVLRALGARLVRMGALAGPEDVFFMTHAEVCALSKADLAQRGSAIGETTARRAWEMALQQHLRPPLELRFGVAAAEPGPAQGGVERLDGSAGSAGTAVGPARVVSRKNLGEVRSGEILVCDMFRPEWSPVLMYIRGLVTDRGYVLSHGANLARESGMPAVMGTISATRVIRTGDLIRVEGESGRVWIEARAGEIDGQSPNRMGS